MGQPCTYSRRRSSVMASRRNEMRTYCVYTGDFVMLRFFARTARTRPFLDKALAICLFKDEILFIPQFCFYTGLVLVTELLYRNAHRYKLQNNELADNSSPNWKLHRNTCVVWRVDLRHDCNYRIQLKNIVKNDRLLIALLSV